MTDGERLPLAVKELGSCDLYPQVVLALALRKMNLQYNSARINENTDW